MGEGSIQLIEDFLIGKKFEDVVTVQGEAEEEGFELPAIPAAPFALQWWDRNIQEGIKTILNSITSEKRKPKVPKGVRDTVPR